MPGEERIWSDLLLWGPNTCLGMCLFLAPVLRLLDEFSLRAAGVCVADGCACRDPNYLDGEVNVCAIVCLQDRVGILAFSRRGGKRSLNGWDWVSEFDVACRV